MDWEDLLFLHWRVERAALQRLVPADVEVEEFDGSAWLGVVPFRMARTRVRWLPPLPGTAAFPELNVRTYVRHGGRAGVWFFSLDAASRLAVAGARATFGLPYLHARMACERRDGRVCYTSERRDRRAPPARFAASWRSAGAFAAGAAGSLQQFLSERYCLFVADCSGRIRRGDIAHAPWQLAPADVRLEACDMTRLIGVDLRGEPASALCARPVRVAAWWLQGG